MEEDYDQDSPLITSTNSPISTNKSSNHENESVLSSKGGSVFSTRSSPTSQPAASSEISTSSGDHNLIEDESSFIEATDESRKDQVLPVERVCPSFEGDNEESETHDSNGRQNGEILEEVPNSNEGSLLHVDDDDGSISEARRSNRRMVWDGFSGRNSRRRTDISTVLFTSDDADLVGSRRRWILNIDDDDDDDDLIDDGVDVESRRYGRRNRASSERHRNSRSEFRDRLRGTCPYDLHSDGSCSCDLDEDATFFTSISRILLLADALFEVFYQIHRQPDSFSMSVLSNPAPESVVDALPIKTYEKPNSAQVDNGDDVDQCYICLVEYEEGDKIRILPCHHEYHMPCVDRWLKEVHGVCPLCRGEVRGEEVTNDTASNSSDAHLSLA